MKARDTKLGAPSTDLLVCFPSRAHLTLMPKPICSPARQSDPIKRYHHHRFKKSISRDGSGGCQNSPLLWAQNKQMGSEISEPTSPKVTCAGQIKVRHKSSACKNWQSVMEEIERIHNNKRRNSKKRSSWIESFGFKKEVMQFLACLRNISLDFRCFGSIPRADITTDDEEDEEDHNHVGIEEKEEVEEGANQSTLFSKWYMVLQENHQTNQSLFNSTKPKSEEESSNAAPPPNALLLMRCRSAPAKSWLKENNFRCEEEESPEVKDHGSKEKIGGGKNLRTLMEEEKRNSKRENLVVMKYESDFYKISSDIAKETWVVGSGMRSEPFSRSQSWKR